MKWTPRILVDLDGIVVDLLPAWLKALNASEGLSLREEDITSWNMDYLQIPAERLYAPLESREFMANLPPISGACEALQNLNSDFEIYFLTARWRPASILGTYDWFHDHLPWVKNHQLVFCQHKHIIDGDVLIDDHPENLRDWQAAQCGQTMTIDYAYNRSLPVNVRSLDKNWDRFLQELLTTGVPFRSASHIQQGSWCRVCGGVSDY